MNNVRWVVAGFALGLVMAVAPACGAFGEEKCTASTCQGCCNEDGKCETGTLTNACGLNGGACAVCAATDICQGGFCTPIGSNNNNNNDGGNNNNTDGGNNNTDGGTSCNASNCADGCCVGNVCRRGADNNNLTCGLGGQACQQCTGTLTCSAGECRDTTCNGCVSNGSCVTGTSTTACGFGGLACSVCTSGQSCTNGVCTGGSSCSPSNCSGCCQNGVCQTGTSTSACGLNGTTCSTCTTNQTCTSGSCQTSTTKKIGDMCSSNADCSALGTGATCKLTTTSGNASYPSGYCTKACTATSDCLGQGSCYDFGSFGDSKMCVNACSTSAPCRAGYECYELDSAGTLGCYLNPLPGSTNPAPVGVIGKTCSTNVDCRANFQFTSGGCLMALDSSGTQTGWTGGYCSAWCLGNPSICGTEGTCVNFGSDPNNPTEAYCFKTCANPGNGQGSCRTGYVCDPYGTSGICWANCNNPGATCPTSTTCQANGHCL